MTSSYGRYRIAEGVTDWSTDLAKWYAEDEEMRRRHGERLAANEARTLKIQKEESIPEFIKDSGIEELVPKLSKLWKMKEKADQKAEQRKQWAFEQSYADLDVDSQKGVEKWTIYKTKEENIKLDHKKFKIKLNEEVEKGLLTPQAAAFLSDNHGGNVLRVQNQLATNAIQNVFANNQKIINADEKLNLKYQDALIAGGDALKNFHRGLLDDKLADLNFSHEVIANKYGKTISKYLDTKKNLNDAIHYKVRLATEEEAANDAIDALKDDGTNSAITKHLAERKNLALGLSQAKLNKTDKNYEADRKAAEQIWRDDELAFLVRSADSGLLTQDEWNKGLEGEFIANDKSTKKGAELYTEDMRDMVQQAITNKALRDVAQHRAGLKQSMEVKYSTLVDGSWKPTQSEWDTHVKKQLSLGLEPEYGNKMLNIKIASQTEAIEEAAIKRLQIKADKGTLTMQDIKSEKNINAGKQFEAVAQDLDDYKKGGENKWDETLIALNGKISKVLGEKSFDKETGLPFRGIQASTIIEGYASRVLAKKLDDKRKGIAAGTWDYNRNITVEVLEETEMFLDRETFGIDVASGGTGSLAVKTVNGKGIFPNINNYYFKQKLNIDNSEDSNQIINNYEERKKQIPDIKERIKSPNALMSQKDLRIFAGSGQLTEAAKYNIKMHGLDADEGVKEAISALKNSSDEKDKEFLQKLDLAKWDSEIQSESIGETIQKYIDSTTTSPNQKHELKTIQFVMRHIGWDALTPTQKETILKIGGTDLKEGALRDDYHEHLKIQGNIKKNETLKNTLSPADYFGTGEGFQGFIQDTN